MNTSEEQVLVNGHQNLGTSANAMHENGPTTNGVERHVNGTSRSDIFRDVLGYTPSKKLKIVTIGAGFSGLLFAHKLQHQYPEMQNLVEHQIIESRNELGGTWLVNTYPGIQCDVPAHIYVCFSILAALVD